MTAIILSCNSCFVIFATVFFLVVALAHVVRLMTGWELKIGPWIIPHGASLVGALVGAFGAIWGFFVLFMH